MNSNILNLRHLTVLFILCTAFLGGAIPAFAQQGGKKMTGQVIDENKEPMIGVSILIVGTSTGTVTDFDGNYTLNVPKDSKELQFSYVGYETKVIAIPANGNVLNVQMKSDSQVLSDVVVIGYGTQRKSDLTGSVTNVSSKDFNMGLVSSPEQLINGKISGVQIMSNSGSPTSGSTIRVRGGASLNASNDPLIVLDGVPLEQGGISGNDGNFLSLINPNDIESMTILKDASSTAIYGSRASNGVILITTKKGSSDKMKITFSTTNSIQTRTKLADMLSYDQFVNTIRTQGTARKRVAIIEPSEGSPAAEIGLKAGDIIMEINGKDMAQGDRIPNDLTSYVSDNLRGEPGTTCVLKVERPTSDSTYVPMEFKITRSTIRTNPVPYYGIVGNNVGYIVISTFAIENCSKDIKKALIELKQQGAKSIVLDLRGNGGGLLGEAVNVVNFFVPKGKEIVVTKGKIKQAGTTYKTMNEPVDTEIPLAVLVDGSTASASEIVSGSLQDLDRAIVVGSRTYGKGLVQVPRELPYNSSMKVTTAKYYIPSGRCIQAIDYAKRNADGSVARTPDSLTNVFHTAAGREVRDGGGIRPDVEVKVENFPNIMFYLLNDDMIFDYATQYCIKHSQVGEVKDFTITDADYVDFKKMLHKRKFTYDRQSEKMLKNLKEIAEFEGYMDGAKEEFAALETKLTHNLDHELDRFSKEIKDAIAQEILKRYYFQRGAILQRLKDDPDLKKAIETLNNQSEYSKILSVMK